MSSINLRHKISKELALNVSRVEQLIQRAPYTYKKYSIPKNSGGRREIAQPSRETKYLQRWLISKVFIDLSIHGAAMAYREGFGIKANAALHANNDYIIKFDFRNFFPSIKSTDLVLHFAKHLNGYVEQDFEDMARICSLMNRRTNRMGLSVGAPSSPLLSNSVMLDFDIKVSEWALENGVIYTRYADDLTFSTNVENLTQKISSIVKLALGEIDYPKIYLNHKKTVSLSKKHQRRITGLIISNDQNVTIGREKKRLIRSMVHRFVLGRLDEEEISNLQGLLGFVNDVEPLFLSKLRGKYGVGVISKILTHRKGKGIKGNRK